MAVTEDRATLVREMRSLRRTLTTVDDERVLRVVAVVDKLADRGEADELIRPLRHRLATIRPERPLRFARLLFIPADNLLVAPRDWRRNPLSFPRSALLPLSAAVQEALGPLGEQIEQMLAGRTSNDVDTIVNAGHLLWPRAAEFLAQASPPRGWEQSGLSAADHTMISRGCAAVLRHAADIEEVCRLYAAGQPVPDARIIAVASAAAGQSARAWTLLSIILMERLAGHPALLQLAALAARLPGGAGREAIGGTVEAVLERLEQRHGAATWFDSAGLPELAQETRQTAALLDDLRQLPVDAGQQRRSEIMRQRIAETCARRFTDMVNLALRTPIAQSAAVEPSTEDVLAAETVARQLRMLESAGRRLGQAQIYSAGVQATAEQLRNPGWNPGLEPIDRARLLEILVGPDQALDYLARQG